MARDITAAAARQLEPQPALGRRVAGGDVGQQLRLALGSKRGEVLHILALSRTAFTPVTIRARSVKRRGEPQTGWGWGALLTARVEHVELGEDDAPLLHRRGRYLTVG